MARQKEKGMGKKKRGVERKRRERGPADLKIWMCLFAVATFRVNTGRKCIMIKNKAAYTIF